MPTSAILEEAEPPRSTHRDVRAAFGVLFAIVAAHALAETARDTLFLRGLPAERLPWAYLAIAALVVVASPLVARIARAGRVAALRALLVAGAAGHLVFAALTPEGGPRILFALYVWCGLLTTELVVQFWLLLGAHVDVQRAKRAFTRVAAGGVAGAAAGAGLAALLTLVLPVRALLVAAAVVLAAAFAATYVLRWTLAVPAAPALATPPASLAAVRSDGYALRVIATVALLAATTTGVDYLFKASVAAHLPPDRLDDFFARYHAAVNVAALALQLAFAPWLLQRLGVARALLVLPSLTTLGAAGVAAFGGLWPALGLRAVDGALRPSLHAGASEILYLPIAAPQREAVRSLAASIGQRGGQAAASVGLLIALHAGATLAAVAAGTACLGALLLAAAGTLRARYVERFRTGLSALSSEAPVEVPNLDLDALETLFGALASPSPEEVIGALELLAGYGRAHLIPPLILYHPSPRVVRRALDLGAASAPRGFAPLLPWLLGHSDPDVRAAALATRARRGELTPDEERTVLEGLASAGAPARAALARAVAALPPERSLFWLERLAQSGDPDVQAALADEVARAPRLAHVPILIPLLAAPAAREPARRALCALGAPALRALAEALADPATPRAVRRHLPRSISRFPCDAAAPLLVAALAASRDPHVRFKTLRGLGRLRADCPELALDPIPVRAAATRSLERVFTLLTWRLAVRVARADAGGRGALLARLLEEKERRALENAFRALHILTPEVEYGALFAAVRSGDAHARAAACEVLEHAAPEPHRAGLLAAVVPASPEERLAAGLAFHTPFGADALGPLAKGEPPADLDGCAPLLAALWTRMEEDGDRVLAALAASARPARLESERMPEPELGGEHVGG
jgi:AAA family ATP:ADP antiporter